jgi:hypothetical protein
MLNLLTGFGTKDPKTVCIDQVSAIEFNVPAVPELIVPDNSKIGLLTTADESMTGVPAWRIVPVVLVTVMVVVVDAVMTNVPLFPVDVPVKPEIVTEALTQPFEPAPDSVAARVYTQTFPLGLVGATVVLNATVVEAPVTVGVVFCNRSKPAVAGLVPGVADPRVDVPFPPKVDAPVTVSVVADTALGVVLPNAGGDAKFAVVAAVTAAATNASVAISVEVSPGACVVADVPFGNAGVPERFEAVPLVFAALLGMSVETRARYVGARCVDPVAGPART